MFRREGITPADDLWQDTYMPMFRHQNPWTRRPKNQLPYTFSGDSSNLYADITRQLVHEHRDEKNYHSFFKPSSVK